MQWQEIDMVKGEWLIPKERTKNDKAHLIHLAPPALEIINSRPAFMLNPERSYSHAKERLDALIGDWAKRNNLPSPPPDWRIHDLRRTAATGYGIAWLCAAHNRTCLEPYLGCDWWLGGSIPTARIP